MTASTIVLVIALVAVLSLFVSYIVYSYKAYKRMYDRHISLIEENEKILELAQEVHKKNETLMDMLFRNKVALGNDDKNAINDLSD